MICMTPFNKAAANANIHNDRKQISNRMVRELEEGMNYQRELFIMYTGLIVL